MLKEPIGSEGKNYIIVTIPSYLRNVAKGGDPNKAEVSQREWSTTGSTPSGPSLQNTLTWDFWTPVSGTNSRLSLAFFVARWPLSALRPLLHI